MDAPEIFEVRKAIDRWCLLHPLAVILLGNRAHALEVSATPGYFVSVQSEFEKRSIRFQDFIYRGQLNEDLTLAPKLWDIPADIPKEFGNAEVVIPIAHTGRVEVCSSCSGSGRTPCPVCHGSTRRTCGGCGGSGKNSERTTCASCSGIGSLPCNLCCFSGYVNCSYCSAVGKVFRTNLCEVSYIEEADSTPMSLPKLPARLLKRLAAKTLYFSDSRGQVFGSLEAVPIEVRHAVESADAKPVVNGLRRLFARVTVQNVPIWNTQLELGNRRYEFWVFRQAGSHRLFVFPTRLPFSLMRTLLSLGLFAWGAWAIVNSLSYR